MIVEHRGRSLKLRPLTDEEYDRAAKLSRMAGIPLETCPTCGSKPHSTYDDIREEGTYRYLGEERRCECKAQIALRRRYLLANIGDQYMRLNWADFDGSEDAKHMVRIYLDGWEHFKRNGMGIEFGGPLGIGKTFAATHIGKELIKLGQRVYFCPFVEMVSAFEKQDAEALERRLRETTFLILDELLPPISERQHHFYATRFEAFIRHRTNFNLPTIITTNVSQEELHEHYPRTYSLLEAKQQRVDMSGADQRKDRVAQENLEIAINKEVRPIT